MSRYVQPKEELTIEQERFIRMEANGFSTPEIIWDIWQMREADDPKKYHNYECKLSRWRKHPKYEECWKDEVRKYDFSDYTKARKTLRKSMDNDDKWLAMQSAVNVMNTTGKRIFGAEENTVTVQIQGMPEIGSPDGESGND